MVTKQDVVMISEKYGLSLSEYQGKFYLQPVSVVGERVYLQTAAPTWKKNGREEIGKSKIVSFGLGTVAETKIVLQGLVNLLPSNGSGRPVPTPSPGFTEDVDEDLPF